LKRRRIRAFGNARGLTFGDFLGPSDTDGLLFVVLFAPGSSRAEATKPFTGGV
jgi:hypothetical protein